MREKNICKFITEPAYDRIDVHSFIYESNQETMKSVQLLNQHRAILIKQGKGKVKIDNNDFVFDVGNLIFAFKNECFSVTPQEYCEYMYIDFSGIRAETLFYRFCINKSNRLFYGFDGLIPLWHDSLCRASQVNLDLVSEGILLYTFSRLVVNSGEQNNIVNRIIEITEEQFTAPEISIAFIANELSYNAKYISHVFKEKMGVSYSEYLRTLRIKYAVSLLEHGIDSVKNIAFLSGFTDPMYFSTVFKKTVGVSPKEYKKEFYKNKESN